MEKTFEALFAEFPAHAQEAWARQVEKDLKGKPWTALRWSLEEGVDIDPVYHPGSLSLQRDALYGPREGRGWEIGEIILVDEVAPANALAREAIAAGVDSPGFLLLHRQSEASICGLLDGIDPDVCCLNFGELYPDKDPFGLLRLLLDWHRSTGKDKHRFQGSLDIDPFLDWTEPPLDALARAIRTCETEAPQFKILQVNGRYYHAGAGETINELALMVAKGSEYLACMEDKGIPAATTHHFLQFSVAVSTQYFVEIAKLRALRIMWNNVLKGFGVHQPGAPEIIVHLAPETQDENLHTNIIRAGTQAMSAVIGGADRLYILPADAAFQESPSPFTRRIARNIHHLLDLEAHIGKVADPAAGSWYIENLTNLLAEKAWARFQDYDRKGEFKPNA
jgi:methylmalonyl-CoA mutase